MRRGENKILLLARRQYFSNVTFLCSEYSWVLRTEKLFSRQSGWYSGNILRKSQMSCDKLLRNFLSSSSVSLSRLASRPAMTRLINEVWAGDPSHHTEDKRGHDCAQRKDWRNLHYFPTSWLTAVMNQKTEWHEKCKLKHWLDYGVWISTFYRQNPRGRTELIPDCADPGSQVNMCPMCRLLSYPFLTKKYAESMNEKKCRDSYVSFPVRLLDAICLILIIRHGGNPKR